MMHEMGLSATWKGTAGFLAGGMSGGDILTSSLPPGGSPFWLNRVGRLFSGRRPGDIDSPHTVSAKIHPRIGAAHVRFDLVNAAADDMLVDAVKKGAGRPSSTVLRIDPDPAERTHQLQKIVPAKALPAFQIGLGSMQVAPIEFTANPAGHAPFSPLRVARMNLLPPSTQGLHHHLFPPFRCTTHLSVEGLLISPDKVLFG